MNKDELSSFLLSFRDDLSKMIKFEINRALGKYVDTVSDWIWEKTEINTVYDFFNIKRIKHAFDSSQYLNFKDWSKRLKLTTEEIWSRLKEEGFYVPDVNYWSPQYVEHLTTNYKSLLKVDDVKEFSSSGKKSTLVSVAITHINSDKKLKNYFPNHFNATKCDEDYVINLANTFAPLHESMIQVEFMNIIRATMKDISDALPRIELTKFAPKIIDPTFDLALYGILDTLPRLDILKEKIETTKRQWEMEEKANKMMSELLDTDYNESLFAQMVEQ